MMETFDVYLVPDTQKISPSFILSLRDTAPLQQVTLMHVSRDQWGRGDQTYTLKPTNSLRTYVTTIKGKKYILTATVINSQISFQGV